MLARTGVFHGLVALGLLSGLPALAAPSAPCGMPELHPRTPGPASAALRERSGLPPLPGTPNYFGGGCTRPAYSQTMDSTSLPIRLHYEPAHAAMATKVLGWMETSWDLETRSLAAGGLEFPPPAGDGGTGGGSNLMDVYLEPSNFGGYYCPETYVFGADYIATSGWISINPELADDGFTSAAVAHELHHAIQFGIDAHEDASFMEMTSAYVMEVVFDQADAASGFVYVFQSLPHYSLDFFDYGQPYQYGASLWLFWLLDEVYQANGHEALRYVWLTSRQAWDGTTDPGVGNEPDYFDATDAMLAASNLSLQEAYIGFAADRWYTGPYDDGTFAEGASFGSPDTARSLDTADSGDTFTLADDTSEFGASYVKIRIGTPSPEATLTLNWDLAPSKSWAVLVMRPDAQNGRDTVATSDSGTEILTGLDGESEIVLGFVNLGDGNHDPDADDWAGSQVSFSFTLEDPLAEEDGGGSEDPLGCACALDRAPRGVPGSWLPLVLAGFCLALRRRCP